MNNVNTKYITNNMTITLKNINTICYSNISRFMIQCSAGEQAVGRRGLLHRRPEKSLRKSIIAFSFSITETFNVRTWFSPTIPLVTCCCYEFLFISSHSFDEKASEKHKINSLFSIIRYSCELEFIFMIIIIIIICITCCYLMNVWMYHNFSVLRFTSSIFVIQRNMCIIIIINRIIFNKYF